MSAAVRDYHEVLLESLIAGKLSRNLSWNEVLELIEQMGKRQSYGGAGFALQAGDVNKKVIRVA